MLVIDPGHGGHEAIGKSTPRGQTGPDGVPEKDFTLDLSRRIADRVGGGVMLTRSGDYNLSLADRIQSARKYGAKAFVSVHAADHRGSPGGGATIWVHPRASSDSLHLAHGLASALEPRSPTVRQAELAVLSPERFGGTAACLVEVDRSSGTFGAAQQRELDELAARFVQGLGPYISNRRWTPARGYGAQKKVVVENAAKTRFGAGMLGFAEMMPKLYGDWLSRLDNYQRLDLAETLRASPVYTLATNWDGWEHVIREKQELIRALGKPDMLQMLQRNPTAVAALTNNLFQRVPKDWEIVAKASELDPWVRPDVKTKTVGEVFNYLVTNGYVTGVCGITSANLLEVARGCALKAEIKVEAPPKPLKDLEKNNGQALLYLHDLVKSYGSKNVIAFRISCAPHSFLFVIDQGLCAPFHSYFGKQAMGSCLRSYNPITKLETLLSLWPKVWYDQDLGRKHLGFGFEAEKNPIKIDGIVVCKDWSVDKEFTEKWLKSAEEEAMVGQKVKPKKLEAGGDPEAWQQAAVMTMDKFIE